MAWSVTFPRTVLPNFILVRCLFAPSLPFTLNEINTCVSTSICLNLFQFTFSFFLSLSCTPPGHSSPASPWHSLLSDSRLLRLVTRELSRTSKLSVCYQIALENSCAAVLLNSKPGNSHVHQSSQAVGLSQRDCKISLSCPTPVIHFAALQELRRLNPRLELLAKRVKLRFAIP